MRLALGLLAFVALPLAGFSAQEEVAPGWEWFGPAAARLTYTIALDTHQPHGGATSLCISTENRSNAFGAFVQAFRPDSFLGKRVRFSGYLRSANVEAVASFWIRVDSDAESAPFDNMDDRPIAGTTPWTRYALVVDVPRSATQINIGGRLRGSGTVCADDMEFEAVEQSVAATTLIYGSGVVRIPLGPEATHRPRNLAAEPR